MTSLNDYLIELWHEPSASPLANATYGGMAGASHAAFHEKLNERGVQLHGMYHLDPQHRVYMHASAGAIEDVIDALFAAGWMGWCDGRVHPARPIGSRLAILDGSTRPGRNEPPQSTSAEGNLYLVELWHEVTASPLGNPGFASVYRHSLELFPNIAAELRIGINFALEIAPSSKSVMLLTASCVEDVRALLYRAHFMHWNDGQIFPVTPLGQITNTVGIFNPVVRSTHVSLMDGPRGEPAAR